MIRPALPFLSDAKKVSKAMISVLIVLICLPELVITAADLGWIGSPLWRPLSVQYGAFWPGLLRDWQSNYAAQPWVMFLTYTLLHTGLGHMLGNLLVTLWLAPQVLARLGPGDFCLIWIGSAAMGAVGYALLPSGPAPMVGASGSVFGLFGSWLVFRYVFAGRIGAAAGVTLGLALMNALVLIWEDGLLAWQPHLAGFLTGAALTGLLYRDDAPS